ncbi:MAG: DNA-binding response regulator [Sphingobacteriaceae bacterium]|jgi:two-component system nitrate/nitrite response regulator NarL
MPKKDLQILICDASKIFCLGLAELLKKDKHVKHIAWCHTIIDAMRLCESEQFDAAVVEDVMATTNKYSLISNLTKIAPDTAIIITSSACEVKPIDDHFLRGARGFVPKIAADKLIIDTIIKVANGSYAANKKVTQNLKATFCKNAMLNSSFDFKLSSKEMDVLLKITEGKNNKLIAKEMGMAERTVEYHKANIYKKNK